MKKLKFSQQGKSRLRILTITHTMYSRDLIPQRDVAREGARKIPPHEIEVSEGMSIFIERKKINIFLYYRIKDS